jgi:hypothetical protein
MIANPLKVSDIVSELSRGGFRIPEIQRKFVWTRPQIAKLLDSLYRGFPTGSILLWDGPAETEFRDLGTRLGSGVQSDFPPKVVLDGQQRITSLGRVFDTSTPKSERVMFDVFEERFEAYSPRTGADPHWLDVTEFLGGQQKEFEVLEALEERGLVDRNDREKRRALSDRLNRLAGIRNYQYPVEIIRDRDLETATEVFIRVNSGGTRLRDAELALARLAWKLPGTLVGSMEVLEEECEGRGFKLDSRFLMRCLVCAGTGQSSFTDLKKFWERPAGDIQQIWESTARGLRLALDFVEGNVEVPGSEFLPSNYTMIPLVIVYSQRDRLTDGEERLLRRWFLLANSFSRFAGASETKLNQDLSVLGRAGVNVSGLYDSLVSGLRGDLTVVDSDLERAGADSPFFPLSFLAALRNDATDWFNGIRLRGRAFSEDQRVEKHHIFPRRLLNGRGVDRYERDEMANLAFLARKANRSILASSPDQYLVGIAEEAPERLRAQFIPLDRDLWRAERFGDFLRERRRLLAAAMNSVLET